MESFAELDLDPTLVDALAAEGVERPTSFQRQALPVIRRGNNLVGGAGPGAGTLAAWGPALLDRLIGADEDGGGTGPSVLVVAPTAVSGRRSAESLARIARSVGIAVADVEGPWLMAEEADVLFGTARSLLDRVREGRVTLERVTAVVIDQLSQILTLGGAEALETLFDFLDTEAQRVVLDMPPASGGGAVDRADADSFVERHVRRAVHVPPRSVAGEEDEPPPRGEIRSRVVEEPKDGPGLALVTELLHGSRLHHVMIFLRSDDRAADVGDYLALHGYAGGRPGDTSCPVWLAADDLEGRAALDELEDGEAETVALLSWDVPPDPDALDRRHGGGRGGHVMVLPREVAHLRQTARRTGYSVRPHAPPAEERVTDDLVETVERLEDALEREDVAPYLLVLETLFERHDPAEVAAAAVSLLRRKDRAGDGRTSAGSTPSAAAVPSGSETPRSARGTAFVRLFMSVGRRDGAGPGDIVGAVAGEAQIDGKKVGRIDIRDTFSIVEVEEAVAEQVIRAVNGTTVKGRSVRVDYDRKGSGRGERRPKGSGRGTD